MVGSSWNKPQPPPKAKEVLIQRAKSNQDSGYQDSQTSSKGNRDFISRFSKFRAFVSSSTDLVCQPQAHQARQVHQALAIQSSLTLLHRQYPPEGFLV